VRALGFGCEKFLFSFNGRLGRATYWAVLLPVVWVDAGAFGALGGFEPFGGETPPVERQGPSGLIFGEGYSMAGSPNVDAHVGTRLRQRRVLLGLSQTGLGNAVGVTFQQIHKYERGANTISSSTLFEFAKVLDVPVSHFFDEMPATALSDRPGSRRNHAARDEVVIPIEQQDPLIRHEMLELVRAYYKISSNRVRKGVFEAIKAVGVASQAASSVARK
jgi:transcriptional regulator with XRE-family HTH domain